MGQIFTPEACRHIFIKGYIYSFAKVEVFPQQSRQKPQKGQGSGSEIFTIMKASTYLAVTAASFFSGALAEEAASPDRSPITELLPGAQALTLDTWMTQLELAEQPLQNKVHWVYLSGREQCNGTRNVCESFDDAMAKGYHVLKAQGHGHEQKQYQQEILTPSPQFSYIDCDEEPILCHSWLLKPPAIMHITVDPTAEIPILLRPMRIAPSNKTDDDLYARMTPTEARRRLTPIINGERPVTDFHIWDGLMNPFTGHLGKLGLNVPWGWWTHHYGWLPISWHAFCMILLVFCRFMVWQLTPKQKQSAAEMVMNPGAKLGFNDDDLAAEGDEGEDGDEGGNAEQKEEKKDQ